MDYEEEVKDHGKGELNNGFHGNSNHLFWVYPAG